LNSFKDTILKEMANKKNEIETQFVITESFKRYCQEMINKGSACDISRMAYDLHARAEELVKTQDEPDCHQLSGVQITFKPSVVATDSGKKYIGELVLHGQIYFTVGYYLIFLSLDIASAPKSSKLIPLNILYTILMSSVISLTFCRLHCQRS